MWSSQCRLTRPNVRSPLDSEICPFVWWRSFASYYQWTKRWRYASHFTGVLRHLLIVARLLGGSVMMQAMAYDGGLKHPLFKNVGPTLLVVHILANVPSSSPHHLSYPSNTVMQMLYPRNITTLLPRRLGVSLHQ